MMKLLTVVLALLPSGTTDTAAAFAHREMPIEHRYLHLPVRTGAAKKHMKLSIEGQLIREFEIELAEGQARILGVRRPGTVRGKTLASRSTSWPQDSQGLAAITQADDVPDAEQSTSEADRPQFHFTSRRGWHNDPNGLVCQAGNTTSSTSTTPTAGTGATCTGATPISPDLVHWKELPTALYPREFGDWASPAVRWSTRTTRAASRKGSQPPLVAAFTSTGRGECIAFSNDRGQDLAGVRGEPRGQARRARSEARLARARQALDHGRL